MEHVLRPVEPPFTENLEKILEKYPKQDGYLLNVFRVFANSERFLLKGMPNLLDRDSPLSLRERELVILRVCANRGCEYEWGVHVSIFARHAKLTEQQVAATVTREPADFSQADQLLLSAVDELCADGKLTTTKSKFCAQWTKEQQMEIFALAGAYHTLSFVANNSELPPEDFSARFPG